MNTFILHLLPLHRLLVPKFSCSFKGSGSNSCNRSPATALLHVYSRNRLSPSVTSFSSTLSCSPCSPSSSSQSRYRVFVRTHYPLAEPSYLQVGVMTRTYLFRVKSLKAGGR
eukprot:766923-Hanusia_phi.AAC.5